MGIVIDYLAERLAREEEARTEQCRDYLLNRAGYVAQSVLGLKSPEDARQIVMDLMPADDLIIELGLSEAQILQLERNSQ